MGLIMGNFHDDEIEKSSVATTFDPIHDTNALIGMIASGMVLRDEELNESPLFITQMTGVLRKLCQAWIINPENVQSLLGATFYEAMKQLARDVWRKRASLTH